jgi:hypothetical protein
LGYGWAGQQKESQRAFCSTLETADGVVALPEPKAKAGEKAIDMAALVGKNVKVVAKGKIKADGKKHVIRIISVTEEAAGTVAPAAAPAAPAAQ